MTSTSPEKKADWMRGAMQRMDQLLAPYVRQAVREGCACCLGGKREKSVKEIDKRGGSLEERITAANETKYVFGHSVSLQEDGCIIVAFSADGLAPYNCVCLPKAKQSVPITYCYCCGGHIKHHLQIATGRALDLTVLSSAVSSGGQAPCKFSFVEASK